jgi:hypothetical protein
MTCPTRSQSARISRDGRRGVRWWQTSMPQSVPSRTSDTPSVAPTPMLRRYCRCIGDTLRKAQKVMSRGSSSLDRTGTGR